MPALPEAVLELADLACERDDRVLFDGLALRVSAGEAVQVRGANGAGKTTLLRCIAGLHVDYSGTVRILGATDDAGREGLLFFGHRTGLSSALTAAENLAWSGALGGVEQEAGAIAAALARVGLAHWDDVPCQQMSAGQQRRVALARLVLGIGRLPLWLLDEPFTALDDAGIAMVVELMREQLAHGGAVLFATHQEAPGLTPLTTLRMEPGRARLERAA
ncbi:MAG: cytochrome c biogenesis heme-transporting ATPase CcmA [Pseudomonadales bacterium]|nr:cytochrome c biogenesis heme-transporting ATPase CcmA [Pseudomonadales bacterium]